MPDNKHKQWLYKTMQDEGVEVPSYDVFNTDMDDENIRGWYHAKLEELGYDAKSREEFDSAMGYAPATKSEQTRVKKMEQPYVQAQSGAGTYTPGANVKMPTAKETLRENRNYKPKAAAPKASSTKAPAPKVSTAKAAAPKAEDEQQRPGFMPMGMSSFGTSTPQNMVEQGQSEYQPTTLREASEAIVANDADDAVSKAWDMAEQRTREAQSRANRDYVSGSAIVPGQEAMGTSLSAMEASNRAIRMSEHDIERMAEDAWNAIPEEQKNEMYAGISQEILSRYPNASKEDIQRSAEQYARMRVNQKMWEKAVEMNAPKSATDYFFRKVVGANAVRKIEEGLSRSIMGTTGDMYAREVAEQRFEQNGHKFAGVAGTFVGMAVDPMMWIAGGVGSAATKGSMWLGGKIFGETAARRAAATFAGKVATRAVGGAVNFAAFEGMGEALDQYQHGGVAAEQGPHMKKIGEVEYLPTDSWHPQSSGEYSVGDILGKMGHGAVMGGTIGVIGGIIGNVSENAVHATNTLIANDGVRAAAKSGIRAGELGVSTVAEGTIFAVPDMAGVAKEYNKQIASLSDKNSENYIADEEERAAAIERLERKRKEAVMDVWDDSMVMMLGFKAQGAIKSAPKRIAELASSGDGRRGFVERLNRALDGSAPELALTKDEEAELDAAGYTDLKELTKDYKDFEGAKGVRVDAETGAEVEGELPYNRFTELMQDGRVSEAARAKMYYYISGKQLPMSAVMGSNIIENTDENGRASYTVQSFGANGIITSKTYTSKSRAEADVASINRQAELNSLYVGERYYDYMADKKDMYEACKTIGEEKGVVADMLYDLMQKAPAKMSEVEREWAEEILGEYYATRGNNTSETLRNGRYAGIDGIIRKPANKRSEREQQFLNDYLADLYADAKRESMGEDPISDNGESADFKNGYNATPQEAKDIYVGLSLAEREPLAQAKLQEEYRGVMKRIADECDYLAAMERKNMEKMQHKDDKGLHEVVLNRHTDSEDGDVAYIVNGSCELNAQGEWVGDKSVVVYDPATGELKQMFPATDFKELGHVTTAEEVENGIQQGRKRNYENRVAEVTNRVELEPGDRFAMPDGQNAQVIGVEGDNITVLLGDGTQTSISQSELQRQNDEAAMAYYRERFGEPTDEGNGNAGNGIVEGAPASYEPGMSIIVKDDAGNEQNGVVVGRSRSFGLGEYEEDPNGPFVTYVLANGLEYHDTPADLEKKVSGYVVEDEGGEELPAKPASEAGHGGEGGEEPIAEGKPIAEGAPVASGPAEPIADTPAAGEEPEVRMEGAMPIGDDGNPMWLASAPADGHEYLYKNSGLERDEANEFVAAKIAEAEKAAKAIEKKKPKVSTDLAKYKAEKEAWQNDMDASQGAVDYWKDVKGVEDGIEAEAAARIEEEQRAAEEAKAAEEAEKARVEAERVKAEEEAKAKAEAERVEAERKAAEEAKREKELAEKAAAEAEAARVKAEEEARAEAERKSAEEKARLQAKPAMEAGHGEVEGKKGAEVEEGPKSAFDVEESGIPANVRNRQEMLDNAVRAYNDVLSRINPMQSFGGDARKVTFEDFAKQYEENNGSVIAKYDKPYLQGLFDYVSGKLEKLVEEREKKEKEPKWFEINRNKGYEDVEMEAEAIIAKEKDERNSAIQHIRNTNSGIAMERKLIQKASELYGEYFVYDTDMPNDVMELASLFILGKNSKIAWHDTDSGKRGFAKELGMRFGKGGDLNSSFMPYIAKKGEGRSFYDVVTSIYNSVENWPIGSDYPRFQDDEIRDAVIELFMIAQTPNDIKYYMLNNAIERAEDAISNLNERYAVQYAIAEAKEKEEARILSEFVLENAKAISSMSEEEFTEFLLGAGNAYEEWLEEQAKALAELTDEQYNNIKDDRRTNQTDEGRGTEKSASRGSEKEPSQGSNSAHDTRRNDSLEEGARSEVRKQKDSEGSKLLSESETKLRDSLVDAMRRTGLDVITEEAEGQRVLDEAKGNKRMLRVSEREYAIISSQLFSYPEKVERNHVFTDNNYYLCTEINSDGGTFEIVAALQIEGNEDLINELRKEYKERNLESIRTPEGVANLISEIGLRGGWTDWDVPFIEGKSNTEGDGVVDNVALQKEPKREADNENANRLGEKEGWESLEEIDNRLREKRDKIVELLEARGFDNILKSHSTTYGNSYYIKVYSNDYSRELAKIRISDHGVTSTRRVLEEYHVFKNTTPEKVVSDLFGNNTSEKYFRTSEGEVYGFVKDGKVYIDPRVANAETPIHEYSHLWGEALRKANPKAWEQLKKQLSKDKELLEYVNGKYQEIEDEDALMDEVFAQYSGKRGAERMREEMQKEAGEDGSIEDSHIAKMFARLKDILDKFWDMARDLFAGKVKGLNKMKASDFSDMALNDLLNGINPNNITDSDRRTMMGCHNISEDKLRKVFKNGGFANPSMAVVDTRKGVHTDYGEITLIPRWSMMEKSSGRNAGTWTADAWTPTYPRVYRKPSKATDKAYKEIKEEWKRLGGDEAMTDAMINRLFNIAYNNGDDSPRLEYQFLLEKGMQPEIVKKPNKYDKEFVDYIEAMSKETGIPIFELSGQKTDEIGRYLADRMYGRKVEEHKEKFNEEPDEKVQGFLKDLSEEMWVDNFARIDSYIYDTMKKKEEVGKTDVDKTRYKCEDIIRYDEKLQSEYKEWLDKIDTRLALEEKLFSGYDRNGNNRYVANTIENASKLMNRGGQNGNFGWTGTGQFIAKVASTANTIDKMRSAKDKLVSKELAEKHEESRAYIQDELIELSKPLDIPGDFFVGEARIEELATIKGNMQSYAKREWGVELSDEWVKRYNELVDYIKNEYPVFYFETKFNRPVGIDEFDKAVVPSSTAKDIISNLEANGIEVSYYETGSKGDRERAVLEAVKGDDRIMFQKGESRRYRDGEDVERKSYDERVDSARNVGYTKKQYDAYIQREWNNMRSQGKALVDKLGLTDKVEIVDTIDEAGRKGRAKGWYDEKTGKITVVMMNNGGSEDICKTILHEAVGHYGLRQLFGDRFDQFLDNVYDFADRNEKFEIYRIMGEKKVSEREATEEFLSQLAEETDFEGGRAGFWEKVRSIFLDMMHKIGLDSFFIDKITVGELKYILWRSYKNLTEPGRFINRFKGDDDAEMRKANGVASGYADEGGIRFRDGEDVPVFVSNAARALDGIKQEKATPEQWLAMLTKAGGIKAGEDKWMGLSDWLKERAKDGAKSLTKDEVARFVAENAIQIEDVNYGGRELTYYYDEGDGRYHAYDNPDLSYEDKSFGYKFIVYNKGEEVGTFYNLGEARRKITELHAGTKEIHDTRLSYTTEGLDNKKEIALVVPTIESYNKSDNIHFGDAGDGRAVAWVRFGDTTIASDDYNRMSSNVDEYLSEMRKKYNASEGEETDYMTEEEIAHLQDITGKLSELEGKGKRVLVIDEIQSKRHQDGREKGYGKTEKQYIAEEKAFHKEMAEKYGLKLINGYAFGLDKYLSDGERVRLSEVEAYRGGKNDFVPDAPFDKNWHEVAMKRMLRYAAENGYDKVAWTKGEQQADRYDQRKHIDYINCGSNDSRGFTGSISVGIIGSGNIMTDQSGKVIYADSAFSQSVGKPLSDTFGKEIAEQIMSMKSGETLKGDDLFIGGEGMKGFYDKMLPAFMNKYCKKWGTQVGEVTLPNVEEAGRTMWAVDVTQEMRESVMTEPQPMFRGDGEDTVVEKDKETLNALDKEPVEYGYRNVEMREEMDMLSPMGAKLKGNGKEAVANIPFSFLEYERSVEHPELVDENGKIDLVKANGKPLSKVDYNPYIHIRPTKVNYQFAEAWNRPGLIFIKTAYPKSELESGYQADKAKLSVGRHDWNGGELILSRWDKPVGIVPWSEIADDWMAQYGENGVPFNRLHPMLVPILESRGMKILPPDGNVGAAGKAAYEQWRENGTLNTKGAIDDARIGEINKMLENRMSNEPRTMREAASEYATKLNANVNIIEDAEGLTGRKAKAKGWYDMNTGEVNVVIGNHKDVGDVIATISHEVIGHKGLRELVGEEGYDAFLDEVYDHLEDALKERVDERWAREHVRRPETSHEQKRREAVDELLAEMAEKPFEEFSEGERTLWQKIKRKVRELLDKLLGGGKLPGWFKIGDNEIRYMLWRSKEKMERGKEGPIDVARDIVKREELGLDFKDGEDDTDPDGPGNGGGRPRTAARKGDDIRYRDGEEEELKDIMKDGSMGMAEKLTAAKLLIVERNREDAEARRNALRSLGGNLADIRRATGLQKQFDKTTVKRVADLARVMVSSGLFNDIQRGEMRRLLSIVKNSAGKDDLSSAVNTMYDMMLNNNLNTMRGALDKLTEIKAGKVDAKGVEVQGKLDVNGQIMLKAYKKGVGLSSAELDDKIADAMNRMASEDDSLAEEASMEYMGLTIARDFVEGARECLEEIDDIKDMMRHARRDTTEQREYYESLVDAERDAKIDLIESYANVISKLGEAMKGSIERAKSFVEEEKENAREIQHYANSDMKGRKKNEHYQSTTMSKIANGDAARALLSPLSTFDQMLRLFGSKSANGEGYLYNHFMRGVVEARTREIKGYREKCAILDNKVRELFGGKVKNLSDLISHIGKMPKMDVMFMDGGSMEPHKLNQGNLMYIYMVDKMSDGRMKLRKMGITSESVEDITNELNPKLRIMADWIQEEFLVDTRNEYNKTHKALFGAPMASIENYFPLKINSGSRTESADKLDIQGQDQSISTTTGSIIKRRRNNLALDLLNANAIEVLVDHIAQMEHWNAYASFNRDLNVLRTYTPFRNKVKNMNTVYGSGEELWDNFNRVCRMAAGTYDPAGKKAKFYKAIVNINRNVATAKVSFRLWTAIKQLSSIPAFFANARADYMAEGMIAPWKAWEWAMDNLPIFEERWKSRMAGDPRLMKSNKDWKSGRANAVQVASRIGMSPNAFMDALAVSIGSYAIYKTKFGQYKREGFTEEYADKRAKQDAVIAFNQSQQSNEGPFTAPVQVDRTATASALTLFRNASMGYQRQAHDALRNTVKILTPGYRGQSIAFMEKQLMREGLSEEQAKKAATRRYARQVFKNPLNLAIFGWLLPYLWDLMAYAPYLIFGDDDEKKSEMKEDAWQHSKFGWLEGLAGGDVISEGGKMLLMDEFNANYLKKELPLKSDMVMMLKNFENKKYQAVVNDIMNIIVQIGIGVNPQSATDIALAIMDACGNDVELAHEATIMIARIAQVPQSQIEGLYFDEVGLSGDEVSKYTPAELAKRYAEYKVKRGAIYSPWTWEDEDAIEKKEKTSKSLIKERVERLGEKDINDKYLEYEEVYKELAEIQKEAKKCESKDFVRFAKAMDQLKSDKSKYDIYMRFKELDKTLNKLVERYMKAQSGEEAAKLHEQIIEYKADMVKKLEEGNN